MPGHRTEIKRIGKKEEDQYIILIDGREVGISTSYDNAMAIMEWLATAMPDLEKIL